MCAWGPSLYSLSCLTDEPGRARTAVLEPKLPPLHLDHHSDSIMVNNDRESIISEWKDLMNMSVKELEEFLETKESKDVGWSKDGGES